MTTFTKVTNFTDFLEAFLNKFFRFTRDIALTSTQRNLRLRDLTYPYLDYVRSGLGNIFGWVSENYQLTGYGPTGQSRVLTILTCYLFFPFIERALRLVLI